MKAFNDINGVHLSEGDTVKLVKVHHAMNGVAKSYLGSTGKIQCLSVHGQRTPKALVHFAHATIGDFGDASRWWYNCKYLKLIKHED